MGKAFIKGQEVTYFHNWDSRGTVSYRHARVFSCGNKQMVLTDLETGEELGRAFRPEIGDATKVQLFTGYTFPRMSDDEAVATGLKIGKAIVEAQNARYDECIRRNSDSASYCERTEKERSELHEPRCLPRSSLTKFTRQF
jgi:hypothetical protein